MNETGTKPTINPMRLHQTRRTAGHELVDQMDLFAASG